VGEGNADIVVIVGTRLTCRVAPDDPFLLARVEFIAHTSDRPIRPLHLQALLQLPRVADSLGFVPMPIVYELLSELAQELPVAAKWVVLTVSSPRSLHFHEVDTAIVCDVTERFHYLRSPRTDGRAYGLSTDAGRLIALCVSSPLDVDRLRDLLVACARPAESARVVSRVFVFEGAPRNSISYLLSRVSQAERLLGVTDLVTYVNPNMGFTGTSYRASGWQQLGDEPGTTYRYLDSRYITDRRLEEEFGKHDDLGYRQLLGERFGISTMPLAPLLVFHSKLI
jgi:hypothetical protein